MTGLLHHRIVKYTALINLVYLSYVLSSLFFGIFPFNYMWQKIALLLFLINMSVHARLGLWAIVTDYIPYNFQSFLLRIIDLYLFIILIWVIILICT